MKYERYTKPVVDDVMDKVYEWMRLNQGMYPLKLSSDYWENSLHRPHPEKTRQLRLRLFPPFGWKGEKEYVEQMQVWGNAIDNIAHRTLLLAGQNPDGYKAWFSKETEYKNPAFTLNFHYQSFTGKPFQWVAWREGDHVKGVYGERLWYINDAIVHINPDGLVTLEILSTCTIRYPRDGKFHKAGETIEKGPGYMQLIRSGPIKYLR